MQLDTIGFGTLAYEARDLLLFPEGLIGLEHLHAWVLLRERPLTWLQAVEDLQVAVPLVSPFPYVANYRLRLPFSDGGLLELNGPGQAVVLVAVDRHDKQWTLNLRQPILIRPDQRLGRQVIAGSEHSIQHALPRSRGSARKCA